MKKGFTLIELLAVVTILGFMGLVIMPNIINIIENSKKKDFKNDVDMLLNVSETYMTNNWSDMGSLGADQYSYIHYLDLVSENYVDNINDFDAVLVFYNNSVSGKIESYVFASSEIYYIEGVKMGFSTSDIEQGTKDYLSLFDGTFDSLYDLNLSGDKLVIVSK